MDIFIPNRKLWMPDNIIADSLASPIGIARMIQRNRQIRCLSPHRVMMGASGASIVPTLPHTKAVDFNGTDEEMANSTLQTIGVGNAITMLMWVEPDDMTVLAVAVQIGGSSTESEFKIFLRNTDEMQITLRNSSGTTFKSYITNNSPLSINTKYQIGFTWDGTNLKFYINGSENTNITKNADDADSLGTDNRIVRIGSTGGSQFFNGEISAVYLWNSALSVASISSIYNSGTGYQLDLRDSIGSYTETANLKHQWLLGNNDLSDAVIGVDYVDSGRINISDNQVNITTADIVTF